MITRLQRKEIDRMSQGKIFVVYDDFGVIRATAVSAHPNAKVANRTVSESMRSSTRDWVGTN